MATKEASEKKTQQKKFIRTAKGKRRQLKRIPRGRAYIQASLNNTIVTISDENGNMIAWASSGNCGFKGPKKATPYAASVVVEKVVDAIAPYDMREVHVITKGIGGGRDSAIRTLNTKGLEVLSIKEVTPVPHNGCRPRKARRV
jgi:small subunit ribosomal protein S11